jgi:hypothetical protein
MLNKGQIQVGDSGTRRQISYGDQSPATDAAPLTWNTGDVRYNVAAGLPAAQATRWICISGGTPGVWIEMFEAPFYALINRQFEFNTTPFNTQPWPVGQAIYAAAATDDWEFQGESPSIPLLCPLPGNPGGSAPGRGFILLSIFLRQNTFTTPTPNGLLFEVVDQAGNVVASGNLDAGGVTGAFTAASVSGLTFDTITGLTTRVTSAGGAGAAVDFSFVMVMQAGITLQAP